MASTRVSTSGAGTLNAVLYAVTLVACLRVGFELALSGRVPSRPSIAAGALWLVVAVPSVLRFAVPSLFLTLRRDPGLIRAHWQWSRVLTSALVQSGGLAGTVFNLTALAFVTLVAGLVWGGPSTVVLFAIAQCGFGVAATFVSARPDAGASGATFALAASIVGAALTGPLPKVRLVLCAVVIAAGVVALARLDAHGLAILGGVGLGLIAAGNTATTHVHHARTRPPEPPPAG